MFTDSEILAGTRCRDALNLDADAPAQLLAIIASGMSQAWAPGYAETFEALGPRAAAMESRLGIIIGASVLLGTPYAALPKPPVCYCVCATGDLVPTAVPFPSAPLARWGIPVADVSAAAALIAQGDAAVLAALAAAQ